MRKKEIISFAIGLLLTISPALAIDSVKIPLLGQINLDLPLPVLGVILGLADGIFNPCALSVLFFFIAYIISVGSKKKSLILGTVYCSMIFLVYTFFMYGISFLISIVGYMSLIKTIVGYIIIFAGLIQIKDFFFYGKWISLEIPNFAGPKIERLVSMATIPSAILLGFFVSLVEIPCAGSFPLVYTTVLAERVSGVTTLLYLLWYNLFFVFPLLLLNIVFYFGLMQVEKAEELRKKFRKHMRLISGLMLVILGIMFVLRVW